MFIDMLIHNANKLHDHNPQKKFLIISCVFPPEPVVSAKISMQLALGLAKKDCVVTVLAPKPSRPNGFDFTVFEKEGYLEYFKTELPGINVIHLSSFTSANAKLISRLRENISFGIAAANYVEQQAGQFDYIYINSWPLFSQYLIAKSAVKINVPYLVHIQDIYPESLTNKLPTMIGSICNRILMPIEKFHLRHAKKIVVISENMKSYFVKSRNVKEERLSVVYNWQDENQFLNIKDNPASDKFNFTYLGNIGPVAGVEMLIRAFGAANLADCCLTIAGGGTSKEQCIKVASLFPMADIRFEVVPEGDVGKIQKKADVLLLPVIKGGALSSIPSKLPAYMLSGKPILATLDGDSDTARAILNAGAGWVGEAGDEKWLSNMMKMVSKMNLKTLEAIGQKGYVYSMQHFSRDKNLEKLINEFV